MLSEKHQWSRPIDRNLPDAADLARNVHFLPKQGKIWLDEQRGILQTLPALATLWHELVRTMGINRARKVFLRSGYKNGQLDAELARKSRPNATITDQLLAGPQMHMLRGMAEVELVILEIDLASGHFLMENIWLNSYEVDIALSEMSTFDLPVCWGLLGYASGFSTAIIGIDILFREVSCRGKGDHECRVVGKPLSEWDDPTDYEVFSGSDSLIDILYDLQSKTPSDPMNQLEHKIFSKLVGQSRRFKDMCALANKVATSQASVLLTGETGVGKELIARAIHDHSERSKQPFVAINCASIPQDLIEAELFGVEKGAYTGATQSRQGRFERANKGTIFLDEVVELSARAQATLLRVLQERELERVGGTRVLNINVRVIAATNEDLETAVKQGKFRADLFYRLNVFPLNVPPLRDRRDDIPLLAEFFIDKYESLYSTQTLGLSDKAMNQLLKYQWPGNVRELENVIERSIILTENHQRISANSLFLDIKEIAPHAGIDAAIDGLTPNSPDVSPTSASLLAKWVGTVFDQAITMDSVESLLVQRAMELSEGNVSRAARLLGMSRPAFAYRLKKLEP